MQTDPYDLVEPATGETPVIVEVPHAGLAMDAVTMALCVAPIEAVARDADLYVDELVNGAVEEGASVLLARMSRYVLDLNRAADDLDALAVEGGERKDRPCGLLWRTTADGRPALAAPVSRQELERRLELVYRPYHRALDAVVSRKLNRFSSVVVLSVHSMPTQTRRIDGRRVQVTADVVAGTRGRTSAGSWLLEVVGAHVRAFGWSLAYDDPYQGGATTTRLGRPERGMHAIQIELARRLYMDEQTLVPKAEGLATVRGFCRGLVAKLAQSALGSRPDRPHAH